MERVIEDEKLLPVFKMCDLKKHFDTELSQLHKSLPSETHSARFKNKLLSHFPNLESHNVGRDVLLVTKDTKDSMGKLLRRLVVDGRKNTPDFHFPLRIKAKISEYASILTFQIALSFQVNFHLALRQQRKNFRFSSIHHIR